MTSPTTTYGVIGAVGTGLAALGASVVAIAVANPTGPTWLPIAGAVLSALGGAVSLTAKALGGIATPDKPAGGAS